MGNIDINMITGSIANRKLAESKATLLLVQVACLMALEGTNRATASQIAEKASQQHGLELPTYFIGKFFSDYGIRKVTIHGQRQLVLDHKRLEDLRQVISAQCEERMTKLESAIDNFKRLPERIASLEKSWQEILTMRQKEQDLAKQITEERQTQSHLPQLVEEARIIQERADKAQRLKEKCKALKREIKAMPLLENRRINLEGEMAKYRAAEKEIAAKEIALNRRIASLQERYKWMTMADLEGQIASAKRELEELNRQINSKRSILDRILRRKMDEVM